MDADEELLKYIWGEYLHPKQYEWVLIAAYIIVFIVSLVGNSLGKSFILIKTLFKFTFLKNQQGSKILLMNKERVKVNLQSVILG